jgi:hypothetical protein
MMLALLKPIIAIPEGIADLNHVKEQYSAVHTPFWRYSLAHFFFIFEPNFQV